jgi:hypothetical protein
MQPRFLVLMAVGNESGDQMNDKIDGAAMSRMLNLGNVLELINNGFNDHPLARA